VGGTPNRKCSFAVFSTAWATDTAYTVPISPEGRTWFFVRGERFFSFTVVTGTATPDVGSQVHPRPMSKFWNRKFRDNVERDRRKQAELEELGWDAIVVWQCETRDLDALKERLIQELDACVDESSGILRRNWRISDRL
jgi:G:T-mismatch repair DNA endonuclease (very short patch repair protein)